jgi:hypothetical protein
MQTFFTLVALIAANCATTWMRVKTQGMTAISIDRASGTGDMILSKSQSAQIAISFGLVVFEELAFRFGIPAVFASNGLSRESARIVSSITFGLVHLCNQYVFTTSYFAMAQQAITTAALGAIIFDLQSLAACVAYHIAYNVVTIAIMVAIVKSALGRGTKTNVGLCTITCEQAPPAVYLGIARTTSPDSPLRKWCCHEVTDAKSVRICLEMQEKMQRVHEKRESAMSHAASN